MLGNRAERYSCNLWLGALVSGTLACGGLESGFTPGSTRLAASGSDSQDARGSWRGTASCMRLLDGDGTHAVDAALNVTATSNSALTLSNLRLGSFDGISCPAFTLDGVANGASRSAGGGFVVDETDIDCGDGEGDMFSCGAQGFVAGDEFHLTLFLSSPNVVAQCFMTLGR